MGRPLGSTTKPQLRNYITRQEIDEILRVAIEKAKSGNETMQKFLLEQYFGKAPQPITGEEGGALKIQIIKYAGDDEDSIQLDSGEASTGNTEQSIEI